MAVEKGSVYVKIEKNEALESKRAILETTEALINTLEAAERFSAICNEEGRIASKLKRKNSEIIAQINSILQGIPQEIKEPEIMEKKQEAKGMKGKGTEKAESRARELREIKARLEKLNNLIK